MPADDQITHEGQAAPQGQGAALGCHAARTSCARRRRRRARAICSMASRGIIPRARTTSRRACVRRLGRSALACACGGRRRCCRGPRAAFTGSPSPRTSTAPAARWVTCPSLGDAGHRQALRRYPRATYKLADPALYDAVVIINLCVPTASGVPLQLLPKEINGVRIIGIDVPVSACRRTQRPRMCSLARCSSLPATRSCRAL